MSDRELLELAAKAAGLDLTGASYVVEDMTGLFYRATPDGPPIAWRPLADDGDALRLAVKLRLGIERECECCVTVRIPDEEDDAEPITERFKSFDWQGEGGPKEVALQSEESATRRAIVRAAAEIGRSLS